METGALLPGAGSGGAASLLRRGAPGPQQPPGTGMRCAGGQHSPARVEAGSCGSSPQTCKGHPWGRAQKPMRLPALPLLREENACHCDTFRTSHSISETHRHTVPLQRAWSSTGTFLLHFYSRLLLPRNLSHPPHPTPPTRVAQFPHVPV